MLTAVAAFALATASLLDASPQARAASEGRADSDTTPRLVVVSSASRRVRRDSMTSRDSAVRRAVGEVRGRVIDAGADFPLAAASLTIEGNGETRSATSSLDGAFAFASIAPGSYTMLVVRPAYRAARLGILVPEGSALVLDVQLTRLPVPLSPMLVQGARADAEVRAAALKAPAARYADGGTSTRTVDLSGAPGGTVTSLLGVAPSRRPSEPGGERDGRTLFIWGAKDAGARVTLDGIPLGAPLHLGGLLPAVDEDVMAPARMWTGGAPARYDGGTDYVLELRTRPANPDSLRLWGTFDVLSERLGGEVPIGEHGSLLAGGRRVHDGALARFAGTDPGYGYRDGVVRLQLRPAPHQALRATMFATDEALQLPRDQGRDEAHWGNRAAALAWEGTHGLRRTLLRGGLSDAAIDLPLLTLRDGHLRAAARRLTMLAEERWSAERWETSVGVEGERLSVERTIAGDSAANAIQTPNVASPCPVTAACSVAPNRARVSGTTLALYIDHRRLLASWLQLGVGVRGGVAPDLAGDSRQVLLPRLSLEATPGEGSTIRVAVGSYSRAATLFDEASGAALFPSNAAAGLATASGGWMSQSTATQLELGASQRWKHALLGAVAYWQRPEVTGLGQSALRHRGFDVNWQYARGVTTIGASYSRILREVQDWVADSSGNVMTSRLEQLASLSASSRLWKLHGAVSASYAHGLSFASVVLERANRNSSPDKADLPLTSVTANASLPTQQSYLRVDASLSGRICVAGPSCRLLLAPYARVLNALDRRDAIFYYRDAPARSANRLGWVPALLSVGVRVDMARSRN